MADIATNIVKTLSYFDVFDHPLSAYEVYSTLSENSVTPPDVDHVLMRLVQNGAIGSHHSYYFLKHRKECIVSNRRECELRAERLIRRARWISHIAKYFPFVRAIFLTGSLSKKIAYKNSDIDFLIVVEARRVWFVRTMMTIFKKTLLLNTNKYFCFNYLIATNALEISPKNPYTAFETATVRPLWNHELFNAFCDSNQWIYNFLPNWTFTKETDRASHKSPWFQKFLELLLRLLPLNTWETSLMNAWKGIWRRRHPDLTDEERNFLFRCTPDVSTRWDVNYYEKILQSRNQAI